MGEPAPSASLVDTGDLPIVWRHKSDEQVYEKARIGRVFNLRRPKRYPLAVVEATTEDHVLQAVRLAKQLQCRVSIRSGGHSWAAWSVRDEAILIDLGQYKHLEIDAASKIAVVSPSTTGRILNAALGELDLMFCGGHCPDVGVGGFLLQGGMGWNCKTWGWACEKVKAVDVVTAEGELRHCDETQNSELLWAARGAGPGFPGVVTKFYLEAREKYHSLLQSVFIYPKSHFKEVTDWVLKLAPDLDSVETVIVAAYPPGIDQPCIIPNFLTFHKTAEESEAALKVVNDTRPPGFITESKSQPTSIADQYRDQAYANPSGHRYCCDNAYISDNEDVGAVLEEAFTTLPHPKAFSLYFSMTPGTKRTLPDMALSMQTDHYFALYTIWESESDDERCQKWVRDIMKDVEKHSEGAYLGDSDFQARRTRFWADDNARKLMEIRRKWDSEGRICGYLDVNDASGVNGLKNEHEWKALANP